MYYRLECDNDLCLLFREGKGNIPRDNHEPQEELKGLPSARVLHPDHEPSKGNKGIKKAAKELARV